MAAALGGTALAVLLLVVFWQSFPGRDPVEPGEEIVEDPRATYETPFRNVRPEVQYVGDEACAGCHRDESRAFHQHPMGLSMMPMAAMAPTQRYEPAVFNPFDVLGARFRIERQGDLVRHKETRLDAEGAVLAETQAEMQYALGSGAQVISYVFARGDYLFQSPISWFAEKKRWDLSPDFDKREDRFERPVRAECLFCHANYAEAVKYTLNRFQTPAFPRGLAIGCERCHGPGELHVRERRELLPVAEGVDYSIVNPKHLAADLRDAVCNQCHLEGEPRILRRGRQVFDYRPGLPLHLFWSLFVRPPDLVEHGKFVGQVEQLRESRCFVQSKGRLGCSTCHDAHAQPAAAKKTASYRQHCVDCHQTKVCTVPAAERQQPNDDNCMACHMERLSSTDVNHTSITDHRILRLPEKEAARPVPRKLLPGEVPFVDFHKDQVKPRDPEVGRDTGLALVEMAQQGGPLAAQLGETALPFLKAALQRGPRDAPAHEALAFVLAQQGKPKEALAEVEKVLARSPWRELALVAAAGHAEKSGDYKKAIDCWGRAVAVNPWRSDYRLGHGRALNLHGDHDRAIAVCQETLQFNPGSVKIRSLLVSSYLESKRKDRAQAEFETILKLNPPNKDELQQWFEQQTR